ncbi:MAG: hypothetical protein QME66_04765 [Candidatus Eisenbacteria bacterium]|nr:hypothetical protein [Candidatus Eisenbacteria bacterium]
MSILSDIRAILKEIPLSDILREKLTITERSITQLEKENIDLKNKNAEMSKEVGKLQEELATLRATKDNFVEERGALFKRKPSGGYHEAVFCPGCRSPLSSLGGDFPYICHKCSIQLDFSLKDLPAILKSLPQ